MKKTKANALVLILATVLTTSALAAALGDHHWLGKGIMYGKIASVTFYDNNGSNGGPDRYMECSPDHFLAIWDHNPADSRITFFDGSQEWEDI
jgi:hypothetical protein